MTTKRTLALSIRQPYVELILRGRKRWEERGRATEVRGRILLYAALQPAFDPASWHRVGKSPGSLPTGKLLGTVEVFDCKRRGSRYQWLLRRPRRLARPLRPRKHPQPVWFYPS
jgi:hypothetical protein